MTTGPDFRNRANYIDVLRRDVSLGGFRQCSFDGVLAVGDCDGRNALGATFGTPSCGSKLHYYMGRLVGSMIQIRSMLAALFAPQCSQSHAQLTQLACQMNVLF